MEGGEWPSLDRGDLDEPGLAQGIARRTGLSEAEVHAVIAAVYEELQPLPESVALLQRFQRQGLRQHFFSNMPASYADHIERNHGFLGHFESGLFSGRVKRMKPERGFYELAHERFGLEGQSVVFIDDHPENVRAARAFGWEAVLFKDARQVAGELKALGLPA